MLLGWSALGVLPMPATAGTLQNDPKGFHGIQWGSSLAKAPDLTLINAEEHIQEYALKQGPLPLGEAKVESMTFYAYDGEFARVGVRYKGKKTHEQVLAYLQSHYGPIDRSPGSMMRGLNQQFNWRGTDTEINLTYEAKGERGFVFFDSRTLAPKFNEFLPIAYPNGPDRPPLRISPPLSSFQPHL
ncbi:MAG: hypothetical protein HY205_00980 [Nitrospirae bacterium]|nr:hypothetical protein [Nitrospirota bacterium]